MSSLIVEFKLKFSIRAHGHTLKHNAKYNKTLQTNFSNI